MRPSLRVARITWKPTAPAKAVKECYDALLDCPVIIYLRPEDPDETWLIRWADGHDSRTLQ